MPEAAWGPEPRPCPSRKSYPHVAMMQSGQDLCGDDGPRSLDGASSRRAKEEPLITARPLQAIERPFVSVN